ncbi:MAG: hypothetical protein KatS3mg061_2219 [Dehalococcoidia bacterium]|nr:MAG: hypothetical protein KatS3mg061_2219 [Dehalococcoidia bacterium]
MPTVIQRTVRWLAVTASLAGLLGTACGPAVLGGRGIDAPTATAPPGETASLPASPRGSPSPSAALPSVSPTASIPPATSATRSLPPASPTASAAPSPPASGGTATPAPARPSPTLAVAVATPAPNDLLFPVSRQLALPASYVPPDLVPLTGIARLVRGTHQVRQVVVEDLKRMLAAMEAAGLQPAISSAYRSYAEQEATYAYWVHTLGQREADRVSARPGHSEHQLGTAIDFASAENGYELEESFATTREGRWLLANAARYGFVLSYPAGKEAITGYAYEPWHYRYVGVAAAQEIARLGLTPLEYYRSRAR